jgi:hypothetical protein
MAGKRQPDNSDLIAVASLLEFFRDSVDAALSANKVEVEPHTSHYVVNLLTLFARSEALYQQTAEGTGLRPLALMLADAAEAPAGDGRHLALQRLGDVALFVAGFMEASLDRSPVGFDYYVRMGGSAYRSLSVTLPANARGRAFAPIFAELGCKFQDIVDVLAEVRHAAGSANEDVLRLYEIWLRTGSRRASRILGRLGVPPVLQGGSVREH